MRGVSLQRGRLVACAARRPLGWAACRRSAVSAGIMDARTRETILDVVGRPTPAPVTICMHTSAQMGPGRPGARSNRRTPSGRRDPDRAGRASSNSVLTFQLLNLLVDWDENIQTLAGGDAGGRRRLARPWLVRRLDARAGMFTGPQWWRGARVRTGLAFLHSFRPGGARKVSRARAPRSHQADLELGARLTGAHQQQHERPARWALRTSRARTQLFAACQPPEG